MYNNKYFTKNINKIISLSRRFTNAVGKFCGIWKKKYRKFSEISPYTEHFRHHPTQACSRAYNEIMLIHFRFSAPCCLWIANYNRVSRAWRWKNSRRSSTKCDTFSRFIWSILISWSRVLNKEAFSATVSRSTATAILLFGQTNYYG